MVHSYCDEMLWLIFLTLSIVGSTSGYPQETGDVTVGLNLFDFLASLSIPFFGFGYNEEQQNGVIFNDENQNSEQQNGGIIDDEKSNSEDDSSGAGVGSFAEVGLNADGTLFVNSAAGAAEEQDESDEGFALYSFTSTVIQAIGDDVSMDTIAGSQVIEEDGDQANSLSVASLDIDDNGITASSNTLSGASINGDPNNIETQLPT